MPLPGCQTETVLETAAALLCLPKDPADSDPIRFHLLHLPNGRDVFLMQYNHMLMDNNATGLLLRRIRQLASRDRATTFRRREVKNPIMQYLRRHPISKRREATDRTIHLQGRVLRGQAAVLGRGARSTTEPARLEIAVRELDPDQTQKLRSRVIQLCGLPSLSMALLASVFRAIDQHAPQQRQAGRNFVAGIGLDLPGLRNADGPFFQNIMSLVPIYAQPDQLADRDQLIRLLSEQMRQTLQQGVDLGTLRMAAVFSRRPRYFRWVVEHLVRYGYSLWYAFFGSLDSVGEQFCGADIERILYIGPTWSPVGLTVLVNQYRGRLHFQATYDPDLVPRPLVEEFLDTFLDDLPLD
jgi:hypothetical protein